jgi:beta-lactamase regulating signal transducer with metallopeptidase domain
MELLVTFALKSLLIAGGVLALLHLLRSRSAAERSSVAHLGLLALVLFPLGSMFLPQVVVSLPLLEAAPAVSNTLAPGPIVPAGTVAARGVDVTPAPLSWWPLLYGLPALALLALTCLAVLRLLALRARASVLVEPSWLSALAHAQRRMEFKHGTALLTSSELRSPISWGVLRPVILLNNEALMAHEEAEAIIAHELAHVRGLDWAKLLLGRIATALFWFNPLVWLLAREAHQLREETADDAVLAANVASTDYAQLLVSVARHDCKGLLLGAHGVAPGKGSLTRRVRRVLDGTLPRSPVTKSFAAGLFLSVIGTAAPLAALTLTPHAVSGSSDRVALVAPDPTGSLPSLVAHSLADATAVSGKALGVAMAGEEVIGQRRSAQESGYATVAQGREVKEELQQDVLRLHGAKPPSRPAHDPQINPSIIIDELGVRVNARFGPGVRITEGQLLGARAVGVTPSWLRGMREAGYRSDDLSELTGARAVGVSPAYVAELAAVGLRNVALDELTAMRALGVSGRTVRDLRASGQRNLTPARIIELQALGIQSFAAGHSEPPRNWPPEPPEPLEAHDPADLHDPDPGR